MLDSNLTFFICYLWSLSIFQVITGHITHITVSGYTCNKCRECGSRTLNASFQQLQALWRTQLHRLQLYFVIIIFVTTTNSYICNSVCKNMFNNRHFHIIKVTRRPAFGGTVHIFHNLCRVSKVPTFSIKLNFVFVKIIVLRSNNPSICFVF